MPLNFKTYSQYLAAKFPSAAKLQKIGVTTGFSCPNRDGTIGLGGCAYCNNASFTPEYGGVTSTITEQLEKGKAFFARKYPSMQYLAYFQSYTNTHGTDEDTLMGLYREASRVSGVKGLILGTRPDCMPDSLIEKLARMNRDEVPVLMEFGAETSHNETLRAVNRCHTWETTVDTVHRVASAGLSVGLHFIMGLPGETEDMMLQTVRRAIELPIDTLKFHQLQIIRGTQFAHEYSRNPDMFQLFTPETYIALCHKIIDIVASTSIAIERFVSQSPDNLLIAPRWGLKNYQFMNILQKSNQK